MFLKNRKVTAGKFDIIVNDTTLNLTDDMTVLGINIDSQLNFNVHVLICAISPVDSCMSYNA